MSTYEYYHSWTSTWVHNVPPAERPYEEIYTTKSPSGSKVWNPCYHSKVEVVNQTWTDWMGYQRRVSTWPLDLALPAQAVAHVKDRLGNYVSPPKLQFQSNNKFRIFIFLYTIDDLFAKFTAKWVASLISMRKRDIYGFLKWDLGPMVGDFEALVATYFDLRFAIMNELRSLEPLRFNAVIPVPNVELNSLHTYWGSIATHGLLTPKNVPDQITLPILLDEFGLNFRFTDILDAVPFSFLLSHVLPNIGAFLDSQHPSKWFDAEYEYSGWIMIRLNGTAHVRVDSASPYAPAGYRVFDRSKLGFIPGKKPELIWKFPGIAALLDAIALLGSGMSIKKRIGKRQ